jgi:hypothetical protein
MKKTFQLQVEGKHPERLLEAIKHDIRSALPAKRWNIKSATPLTAWMMTTTIDHGWMLALIGKPPQKSHLLRWLFFARSKAPCLFV